jgi:hypothetical protein
MIGADVDPTAGRLIAEHAEKNGVFAALCVDEESTVVGSSESYVSSRARN